MSAQFINELKTALQEYGSVDAQIAKLESQKKLLRNQIKKWMDLNNTDHFEVEDENQQVWKLKIDIQSRKSIGDWLVLEQILGDSNKHLIVEKDFDVFGIKKIKKFSDEWLNK